MLDVLTSWGASETELKREEVLTNILRQCSARFYKHVVRFLNELKQAQCPSDTRLRYPVFSLREGTTESADDMNRLGPHNCHTHWAYMQLSCERLCQLRSICVELTTSGSQPTVPKMILLAKIAYDVRRSSSFNRFLRHNILATQKIMAIRSMAEDLKERLGKISRFWGAATSIMSFGSIILSRKTAIQVSCLPSVKHTVHELCKRTPAQLHIRGGQHFKSCNDAHLQQKLGQWPRYRLHCEMQLVIFYQENPHLRLRSRYIACDKLACYLCHTFITAHGAFQIKGCHQGLYSLWTVPRIISFQKDDGALQFQNALRYLANALERRMDTIREAPKLQWKYGTNHESTANLSRISIQLPIVKTDPPLIATNAADASDTMGSRKTSPSGKRVIGLFQIMENPGGEHNLETNEVDHNAAQSDGTTSGAHSSATQLAGDDTSDHSTILAISSTEARQSQRYSDIVGNVSWRALSHTSQSVSTSLPLAEDISNVSPLLEDATDTGDLSVVSWRQSRSFIGALSRIGHWSSRPRSDPISSVPQIATWEGGKTNSQFHFAKGSREVCMQYK